MPLKGPSVRVSAKAEAEMITMRIQDTMIFMSGYERLLIFIVPIRIFFPFPASMYHQNDQNCQLMAAGLSCHQPGCWIFSGIGLS
jgi:hypothetical protein